MNVDETGAHRRLRQCIDTSWRLARNRSIVRIAIAGVMGREVALDRRVGNMFQLHRRSMHMIRSQAEFANEECLPQTMCSNDRARPVAPRLPQAHTAIIEFDFAAARGTANGA